MISSDLKRIIGLQRRLQAQNETIDRLDAELRAAKHEIETLRRMLRRVWALAEAPDLNEKELDIMTALLNRKGDTT